MKLFQFLNDRFWPKADIQEFWHNSAEFQQNLGFARSF